jgi:hypothetical protein
LFVSCYLSFAFTFFPSSPLPSLFNLLQWYSLLDSRNRKKQVIFVFIQRAHRKRRSRDEIIDFTCSPFRDFSDRSSVPWSSPPPFS